MESKILGLKLEAQITENQQRAAITKKMSSSIDLKTAEQLGEIRVKNDEEKENESVPAKSSGVESLGVPPAVPGVSGAPVALEAELPGVPGEFAPIEGGEPVASPGSGPVAEIPV
jgi:hypothetical protein